MFELQRNQRLAMEAGAVWAVPGWSPVLVLILVAYGVAGGTACGPAADFPVDDASGNEGPEDGGTVDGVDDDTASDAGPEVPIGACNNLQPGDDFIETSDTGATTPPDAEGGTLTSGTYHLISTEYYPSRSCARDPVATTLLVDAASATSGTLELATGVLGGTALTESIRYTSGGTFLSTRVECFEPDPGGVQGGAAIIPFSATSTEVRLLTHTPGCGSSVDSYRM